MNTTIAGFALSVLTLVAAGYTLNCMCVARRLHRDPRPFAATVFALVAFAIMEVAWSLSGSIEAVDDYYNTAWRLIDAILVACIWWLVIAASGIRGRRRNPRGIEGSD